MARRGKNRLLYLFIGLFALLAPAIVLYASGWRLDFANLHLVKIGGIFIKGAPAEARITISQVQLGFGQVQLGSSNKPLKDKARKLLTGTLVNNLLPNTYRLRVELPNYHNWEKNVLVRPSVVTEIGPIVLIPKTKPELFLEKPLDAFWISGSALVYRESGGTFFLTEVKDLKKRTNLTLLFNNLKKRLLGYPGYVPIEKVAEQESENLWLINTAKAAYLLDFKKLSLKILPDKSKTIGLDSASTRLDLVPAERKILNEFESAAGTVDDLSRYPEAGYLFARSGSSLYLLDLDIRFPLNFQLIASGIKKHDYENGRLYMLTDRGIVYLDL